MTVFQLLENLQTHFKNIGKTRFLKDYNDAYKYFCHETRLLKRIESYTPEENVISFTLSDYFSDIDGNLVTRVDCLSSSELVDVPTSLKYEIDTGVITFFDYEGEQITTISGIDEIKFYYIAVPDELSNDLDEPEIDSQYHKAPLYMVLKDYYLTNPVLTGVTRDGTQLFGINFQMINYLESEYKKLELSAKRKANE